MVWRQRTPGVPLRSNVVCPWAQAGVTWSLESIVREDARNEFLFGSALTNPTVNPVSVLTSVLTLENVQADIWNVFLIRQPHGG